MIYSRPKDKNVKNTVIPKLEPVSNGSPKNGATMNTHAAHDMKNPLMVLRKDSTKDSNLV